MSRVNERKIQIFDDKKMLTPKQRYTLNLLIDKDFDGIFKQGEVAFSILYDLSKKGFVDIDGGKVITSRRNFCITETGESVLRASNKFLETASENNYEGEEDPNLLLKLKNYYILYILSYFEEGLIIDDLVQRCEGFIVHGTRYDKSFVNSIVDGMQRKGLVEFRKENRKWTITELGHVILLATFEFYVELSNEVLFDENGQERAREAFADFDGGEGGVEKRGEADFAEPGE